MGRQTRDRLVARAAELFRRQGFTGTGIKQIVDAAGVPFASLYHFFPGGKEVLGSEVIRWSGGVYVGLIDACFTSTPDPAVATARFFAGAAHQLRTSDFADACPIATVALEVAGTSEPMRQACAEVFTAWLDALTGHLGRAGIPEPAARELAICLVSALEGAFVLARALRSARPLEVAGASMQAQVRAAAA